MTRKIILCLLFVFEGAIILSAQHLFQGKFIDENDLPIEFLQVTASINDSLVNGEVTDTAGVFSFEIPNGKYTIVADLFGETLYDQEIRITESTDIGTVQVSPKVNLDEVTVVSQKVLIERKIDRLIFNVENSISSSGGDALDVLDVTPKIRVQENQISMVGKSGMSVMVDDRLIQLSKEDLMTFLRSIKSEDIKSIEVITTPPAKYDAEGNSGIVNIKLKTLKKDSWNTSFSTYYQQASSVRGGGGINFNIKKNKLLLSTGLRYLNGVTTRIETSDIYYPESNWRTIFNKEFHINRLSGKFALDYKIKPNWFVGLQYILSSSCPINNENDHGTVTNIYTGQIDSLIETKARSEKLKILNDFNAYSKVKLDSNGRSISFDLTFFDYLHDAERSFKTITMASDFSPTSNGQSNFSNGNQKVQSVAGLIGMEYPTKWMNFAFGVKASGIKTTNDLEVYDLIAEVPQLDSNRTNVFAFKENTQAFHASGQRSFNENWEIKLGLRLEYTQTEGISKSIGQKNTNKYFSAFPTFYLSYVPTEKHSFSLDYGKRIGRPTYSNLNPFRYYTSEYTYFEGNPFLTPQYSHNVDLGYSFNHSLYASLFYLRETEGFGQVTYVDEETNTQYFTFLNYYARNSIGATFSYTFSEFKWWENNNSIDVYYTKPIFEDQIDLESTGGFGMFVSSNNSFLLNPKGTLKGEVNFYYQAPQYELLYKLHAKYKLDLGLQFSLLKNQNLKLSIHAKDIFNTNRDKQTTFSDNIEQTYGYYGDRRQVKLSISYLIGNDKIRSKNKRFGNEDERKRVN